MEPAPQTESPPSPDAYLALIPDLDKLSGIERRAAEVGALMVQRYEKDMRKYAPVQRTEPKPEPGPRRATRTTEEPDVDTHFDDYQYVRGDDTPAQPAAPATMDLSVSPPEAALPPTPAAASAPVTIDADLKATLLDTLNGLLGGVVVSDIHFITGDSQSPECPNANGLVAQIHLDNLPQTLTLPTNTSDHTSEVIPVPFCSETPQTEKDIAQNSTGEDSDDDADDALDWLVYFTESELTEACALLNTSTDQIRTWMAKHGDKKVKHAIKMGKEAWERDEIRSSTFGFVRALLNSKYPMRGIKEDDTDDYLSGKYADLISH